MWNNCTQYESNELDKIQNEAARIVTGATKLASIDSLHTETGWETLGSRRKNHKLTMFYKMKNGLCPDYLVSLVPATVGSASQYPLRNSSDLQTLHTNSRLYYTSFLPSAVRDWNELPEPTRNSPSLNIFKNSLKSNLITPPRYYNTGKRLGQIYHARLRTACRPLRQHLHSKNIVDNPYCTCRRVAEIQIFEKTYLIVIKYETGLKFKMNDYFISDWVVRSKIGSIILKNGEITQCLQKTETQSTVFKLILY